MSGSYYSDALTTVFHGDCRGVMAGMAPASVDAVVTDPPYGLEFMGVAWDAPWKYGFSQMGIPGHRKPSPAYGSSCNPVCRSCHKHQRGKDSCRCEARDFDERPADSSRLYQEWSETWAREAIRVLRPGGHLVAFGGTRTFHRLACAIEDAGFEIRDSIGYGYGQPDTGLYAWVQGQGFPKRHDQLKPAWEPIIVARRPLSEPTIAANVLAHGTGAINVDGCRIPHGPEVNLGALQRQSAASRIDVGGARPGDVLAMYKPAGRWPSNVLLSHSPECEEIGTRRVRSHNPDNKRLSGDDTTPNTYQGRYAARSAVGHADPDGYETVPVFRCAPDCAVALLDAQSGESESKPFAAATTAHRNIYSNGKGSDYTGRGYTDAGGASRFYYTAKASRAERQGATHPTVKPVALMRWLVRLVTPPGGVVLDCFAGSGTTRLAALAEGFRCVLIEQDAGYLEQLCGRVAQIGLDLEAPG